MRTASTCATGRSEIPREVTEWLRAGAPPLVRASVESTVYQSSNGAGRSRLLVRGGLSPAGGVLARRSWCMAHSRGCRLLLVAGRHARGHSRLASVQSHSAEGRHEMMVPNAAHPARHNVHDDEERKIRRTPVISRSGSTQETPPPSSPIRVVHPGRQTREEWPMSASGSHSTPAHTRTSMSTSRWRRVIQVSATSSRPASSSWSCRSSTRALRAGDDTVGQCCVEHRGGDRFVTHHSVLTSAGR